MKNKFLWVGLVVIAIIAIGGYFYPKFSLPSGAASGPDQYTPANFFGGFTRGNYYASTTGTAVTLKASDLVGRDYISFTPIVGATTITFPASSSLSSLVPKTGMTQETCIRNASTTAGITITFAAGTGIDWETVATSTGTMQAPPSIAPDSLGCFKFIRKSKTTTSFDIIAAYTPYVNAD